jgi:hypothetical protein
MPVGGIRTSVISIARLATHPCGGQLSAKTQTTKASARAALRVISPAQPSRHSVSPTSWYQGQVLRRGGKVEAERRQAPHAAQVGELEIEIPHVVVVRDRMRGRQAALGEPPVPLSDRGRRLVGETQPADDIATLPAPVGWLGRAAEQVGAVWGVADPFAADVHGVDAQRHQLN